MSDYAYELKKVEKKLEEKFLCIHDFASLGEQINHIQHYFSFIENTHSPGNKATLTKAIVFFDFYYKAIMDSDDLAHYTIEPYYLIAKDAAINSGLESCAENMQIRLDEIKEKKRPILPSHF